MRELSEDEFLEVRIYIPDEMLLTDPAGVCRLLKEVILPEMELTCELRRRAISNNEKEALRTWWWGVSEYNLPFLREQEEHTGGDAEAQ